MKSLNDLIWNDEQLDLVSEDLSVSSGTLTEPLCAPAKFTTCNVKLTNCNGSNYAVCSTNFSNCTSNPLSNCPSINPLIINGCILPMGVSCGGGDAPELYDCNPIKGIEYT